MISQIENSAPVAEQAPVAMCREWAATNRFRGEGVAIDRHVKFPAKNLEPADVIAVLVREEHAIELLGRDPAKPEAKNQLTRTQPAIERSRQ